MGIGGKAVTVAEDTELYVWSFLKAVAAGRLFAREMLREMLKELASALGLVCLQRRIREVSSCLIGVAGLNELVTAHCSGLQTDASSL